MGELKFPGANKERQESVNNDRDSLMKSGVGESLLSKVRSWLMRPRAIADSQLRKFPTAQLEDAERLLAYSAEMGIKVSSRVRRAVLNARGTKNWDEKTTDLVLAAATLLAQKLKPVTPESLRDCQRYQKSAMHTYQILAIILAILIVPYSVATFVTSAISDAIRKDIVVANALAVKLTEALKVTDSNAPQTQIPSVATLTDLQQFAATTRAIDTRASVLRVFVSGVPGGVPPDPFAAIREDPKLLRLEFEVPLPLPADLSKMAGERITVYQRARYFAVAMDEAASVFYGAMAACILPVLYALLGACAFLLRNFEQQVKARTFTYNDAHAARLVVAGIGGGVVGLFSNFAITQTASIPPLAIAFIVGYAVDVFFSFLESILPKRESRKAPSPRAGIDQPQAPAASS